MRGFFPGPTVAPENAPPSSSSARNYVRLSPKKRPLLPSPRHASPPGMRPDLLPRLMPKDSSRIGSGGGPGEPEDAAQLTVPSVVGAGEPEDAAQLTIPSVALSRGTLCHR